MKNDDVIELEVVEDEPFVMDGCCGGGCEYLPDIEDLPLAYALKVHAYIQKHFDEV